jgi:hypothetical protein
VLGMLWGYLNFILKAWWTLVLVSGVWISLFAWAYANVADRLEQNVGADVFEHLGLDYRDWALQSTATFIGLQQAVQGTLGGDDIQKALIEACRMSHWHRHGQERPMSEAEATRILASARPTMRLWRALYVWEMLVGYIHAGALVTLLLQKFGRK